MGTKRELLERIAQLEAENARLVTENARVIRRWAALIDKLLAKQSKRTQAMYRTRLRIEVAAQQLKRRESHRSWWNIAKELELDTAANPQGLSAETIYRYYLKSLRR